VHLSRPARVVLAGVALLVLLFLYAPLVIILVQSFNRSESAQWPPSGFTLQWWSKALDNTSWQDALWMSLKVATVATVIALVLGTLASFAVQRFEFFGRETISFIIVLPIALPGIVTGIALRSAFDQAGVKIGFFTVVIAHATFCIVVVYNNVLARMRRLSPNVEQASADLGAHPFQTFVYVTFPMIRTALLAGELLAFALSFDEIVVTTFTNQGQDTLPQWILNNIFRGKNVTVVNVIASAVVLLSIIPVWAVQKLTDGGGGGRGAGVVGPEVIPEP
jgi:putative spermidine/putrescine transport system permease protein